MADLPTVAGGRPPYGWGCHPGGSSGDAEHAGGGSRCVLGNGDGEHDAGARVAFPRHRTAGGAFGQPVGIGPCGVARGTIESVGAGAAAGGGRFRDDLSPSVFRADAPGDGSGSVAGR